MMTYEQAVATAMLNCIDRLKRDAWWPWWPYRGDPMTRVYALRRLRARAGLRP